MLRVACIVPTFNGRTELNRLLDSLDDQDFLFDLYLIDSMSSDGTKELAQRRVRNVRVIPSSQFNHGGTRQLVVDENPNYDVYVFLTQDAYLANSQALARITAPFIDPSVGAVCGRQLPHLDAAPLSQHARLFNYPGEGCVKSIEDVPRLGIKSVFISNSFAAYRGQALRASGGFPRHVIFAEDMYVTAKMMLAGWKVAYAADAKCHHSHNYTIAEEFRRYFDMGVFHSRERWIRGKFGGAGGEGLRYLGSELRFLGIRRVYLWPNSLLRNAAKLLGYKLGQQEARLSIAVKRRLGMHRLFWSGPYAAAHSSINAGKQSG